MRVYFFIGLLCAVNADSQYWNNNFLPNWFRVPKSANIRDTKLPSIASEKTKTTTLINNGTTPGSIDLSTSRIKNKTTTTTPIVNSTASLLKERNINSVSTTPISSSTEKSTTAFTTSTVNEGSTVYDTTFLDSATTEELRDISRTHEFYLSKRNKPQIKISTNISQVREFFFNIHGFRVRGNMFGIWTPLPKIIIKYKRTRYRSFYFHGRQFNVFFSLDLK